MAHKTLIDGTAYTVSGGRTLADGTSYNVKNGKVLVDGTEYDISFVLPPAALDLWSSTNTGYNPRYITCVAYANGYWVVGGRYDSGKYGSAPCYARIAYTTSLDGTWETKDIWTGSNHEDCINDIVYANGQWVVCGSHYDGGNICARIAYATTPSGTWTTKDIWSSTSAYIGMYKVAYGNGYWVVCGNSNTSGTVDVAIGYTTALGGTWTEKSICYNNTNEFCLAYINGYWIVGGRYSNYPYIYYCQTPAGSWTAKRMMSSTGEVQDIAYADGYYMAVGMTPSSSSFGYAWYATSLTGTWTGVDLGEVIYESGGRISITYTDGLWIASGAFHNSGGTGARLVYSSDLFNTQNIQELWDSGVAKNYARQTIYANGYYVSVGKYEDDTTYGARIAYSPTIEGFSEIF